jgi:hypothetical protein
VATLASPSVEATNPIPNRVEIEWTAVLAPNTPDHDTELEYTVERKLSSASSWVFVCGTDVTPKPYDALSCTDTVTVEGDYDYRVTAHFRSWTSEGTDSLHVTVDVVPPEVVSIVPVGPSPTNAASVLWMVTFSESVTGVGAGDFILSGPGSSGAEITGVTGGGSSYTVTASTGADGQLGLDLVDDDTIEDVAGNKLGGTGTGNGNFAGQTYLIDKTGPTVTVEQASGQDDPTNVLPIRFAVHFSEPVADFDATDVTRAGTATTAAANVSVMGSGQDYEIVFASPPPITDGTILASIAAASAHDGLGNASSASTSTDNSVMYDTTKPTSSASGVDANWHNADVTATLSATDPGAPATGSGVASIKYQVDGGTLQTIAGNSGNVVIPAPSDHSNDGQHTITFYATDNATNQESPSNSVTVKIDTTKPTSTLTTSPASPDGDNGWFKQSSVSFTLAATDPGVPATGSDVANVKYQIDAEPIQTYAGAVTINTQGDHTVSFFATDNAGNVEATNTTHIKLDNVAPAVTVTHVNGAPVTFAYSSDTTVSSIGGACGTASGDSSIVNWSFSAGSSQSGTATCTAGSWSATLSPHLASPATYTVAATQTDVAGNVGSSGGQSITITTKSVSAPAAGVYTLTVPAHVTSFTFDMKGAGGGGGSSGASGGAGGRVTGTITIPDSATPTTFAVVVGGAGGGGSTSATGAAGSGGPGCSAGGLGGNAGSGSSAHRGGGGGGATCIYLQGAPAGTIVMVGGGGGGGGKAAAGLGGAGAGPGNGGNGTASSGGFGQGGQAATGGTGGAGGTGSPANGNGVAGATGGACATGVCGAGGGGGAGGSQGSSQRGGGGGGGGGGWRSGGGGGGGHSNTSNGGGGGGGGSAYFGGSGSYAVSGVAHGTGSTGGTAGTAGGSGSATFSGVGLTISP